MVNMNTTKQFLAGAMTVFLLAACQGQNPFKRESNPVRNYPHVNDSITKREGVVPYGQKQEVKPEPDNSQYICSGPFEVSGEKVLRFMENAATSYEISIRNRLGDAFEVEVGSLSKDITFRRLPKNLPANEAVYQVAWTPKIPAGESILEKTLTLNFKSNILSQRCQGAIAVENIVLLAVKSKDRPVVSIKGLPQTAATFGQDLPFTVEVTDKAADPASPPILNGAVFSSQALSGEREVLDGSGAVANCDVSPAYDDKTQRFRFSCNFTSSLLEKGADKAIIGSGKTADVVFFMTATSRRNGLDSNMARATIKMTFPRSVNLIPEGQNK